MAVPLLLDLSLMLLVVCAAVNDLLSRRIPNLLLMAGMLGAFALHLLSAAPVNSVVAGLGGIVTGLLLFLPLYCVRGMAAGDVKLLATVGAFSTPGEVLQIAVWSVCAGGVMALAAVLAKGKLRTVGVNLRCLLRPLLMRLIGLPAVVEPLPQASVGTIPYGLAIACGTLFIIAKRAV